MAWRFGSPEWNHTEPLTSRLDTSLILVQGSRAFVAEFMGDGQSYRNENVKRFLASASHSRPLGPDPEAKTLNDPKTRNPGVLSARLNPVNLCKTPGLKRPKPRTIENLDNESCKP